MNGEHHFNEIHAFTHLTATSVTGNSGSNPERDHGNKFFDRQRSVSGNLRVLDTGRGVDTVTLSKSFFYGFQDIKTSLRFYIKARFYFGLL
jgi:hypothetical protein